MSNMIEIFRNKELDVEVRVFEVDNEPYFVARDLAESLGYDLDRKGNIGYDPTNAMIKLIDEEDVFDKKSLSYLKSDKDLKGVHHKSKFINEFGMYAAIFGSKLPKAKAFRRWVTKEVLPTIRKTGSYSLINENNDGKIIAEIAEIKARETETYERITDMRIERLAKLRELGASVDPYTLINTGKVKSILEKDTSELLTNAYSDIRTGIKVFSATSLLIKKDIPIRGVDFNAVMVQAGLLKDYVYNGKKYRIFSEKVNYYGYNQDSSSIKIDPQFARYYEDRFMELIKFLKDESFLDI